MVRLPGESTGGSHAGTTTTAQAGTTSPDEPPSNDEGGVIAAAGQGFGGATGGRPSKGGAGGGPAIGIGVPPIDGRCPPNSLKHPDMLCYCQPQTLSACPDGCGDLQTDPDHCGDCANQCGATQACNAGICGPAPKLVTHLGVSCSDTSLALAGSRLYYTDSLNGTVASIATNGKAPLSIATGQAQPAQIAVSNDTVYWLARGTHSVLTVSASGGVPETVASDADGINGFTLDEAGTSLYFSSRSFIFKTTAAPFGSAALVGQEESGYPIVLAISGNRAATPTDINGDVDVVHLDQNDPAVCASEGSVVANHNCVRVSRSQGSLLFSHIELIDDQVYWVNGTSIYTSSASKPSGFSDTVAQATSPIANMVTAFTTYGGQVYFADDSGTVYRAPLMINANPTIMARGQGFVGSMVTDGVNLYWINGGCSISSLVVK
ncbi:MAG TPA: hypothetical protein VHB79_33340 [Polyangiaceae bacterium]|nr:hypothetical protein [Polyangiaceae bacterium]